MCYWSRIKNNFDIFYIFATLSAKNVKKSIFCIFFNLIARIFKYGLDDTYGIVLQYLKKLQAVNHYFGPFCPIFFAAAGAFHLKSSWCTDLFSESINFFINRANKIFNLSKYEPFILSVRRIRERIFKFWKFSMSHI